MQFNFTSECCSDGYEAVEAIKARVSSKKPLFKLIMMDYSMPTLDGPGATVAIRDYLNKQGFPRQQQPYICCLTAYSEKSFYDSAI